MGGQSIFEHLDYRDYLREAGQGRGARRGKPLRYSQWARQLGYRSPRGIAMVLQGKRVPSADMLQRISTYLSHSETEHRYFEKLVEREKRRRGNQSTEAVERELMDLNPKVDPTHPLTLQEFSLMGKWFFYVVKQLIDTPGFKEDYAWIVRRLREKLSVVEVRAALRVLTQLGLVDRDPKTGRLRNTKRSVSTPNDVRSEALRNHHRELAERAIEAIDEQDTSAREFRTVTLRVAPQSLPEIKEALRQFALKFDKTFENLESDHVYQLNLQFFEHTAHPDRKPRHVH